MNTTVAAKPPVSHPFERGTAMLSGGRDRPGHGHQVHQNQPQSEADEAVR